MSKAMNHVIEINAQRYIIRQAHQKLLLLTFPDLHLIHKYYTNANFTYLNPTSHEILVLNLNEITILKPVVIPLQLACEQQSFVDWHPSGGILMQHQIVLFGTHGIIFYTKSNIMEKTWQIEVLQDIEELKCNSSEQALVMKVRQAQKSLFLWKLAELSSKPAQEITLTQPILQFDFLNQDTLAILTNLQLRIYVHSQTQFNLYHFFLVNATSFAALPSSPSPTLPQYISVNTVVLLGNNGEAKLLQLYGLEKRLLKSQSKLVGEFRLECDSATTRKVISVWGQSRQIRFVCQGQDKQLITIELDKDLKITRSKCFQWRLGSFLEQAYVQNNLAQIKDSTGWKYYQIQSRDNFKLLESLNCQKAFIWSNQQFLYINQQALFIKKVGGEKSQPIPIKYSRKDRVHRLTHTDETYFLVSGIKFYRLEKGVLALAGFALKNERAQLIAVDTLTSTLTYQLADQFILFSYKVVGQKVVATTLKSSTNVLTAIKGDRWIQKQQLQFRVGQGQNILAVFSISKLLKILDSENKIYNYSVYGLNDGGLAIIIKNYVFFLQLVEQDRGSEIVLIKRTNSLLFHRFNPHCPSIKLLDADKLVFLVGNTLQRIQNRINPHAMVEPFSPPQTLLKKQLQLRKCCPPQHPRLLQLLIETGKLNLALEILKKIRIWFNQDQSLMALYQSITIQFVTDALWTEKEEDISRWPEQVTSQQTQTLTKFSQEILQKIDGLKLRQKTPLLFESLIRSLCAFLKNNKMVDYFSQSVLIIAKSGISKVKGLSSMSIAYLAHSLNKQEAAAELKPERVSWQWLKQFSIPLWYDGKEQLKKWIEQMAAQEYRQTKDPFNCLLWYLLVGKRAILSTLFKNHKLDSKQHQAIADFLARDFSQPKDKSAAIKNAYVLIDKKRYYHALSFFILGGAMDDCVRLAIDRLKDLNLGYLFVLMFKQASSSYLTQVMMKGDVWMKHLAYKLSAKHILSYNCLFEEGAASNWGYQPELTGFHPALLEFAFKIRNSIAVKRELQQQKRQQNQSQDIFADFYGSSTTTTQTQQQQIVELIGDIDQLKPKAIKYYLAEGVPLLALALQESNNQAKQAYYLELYQIGGVVKPEIQSVVMGLSDKLATFQCLLTSKKYQKVILYLKSLMEDVKESLQELQIVQVLSIKKHLVGQLLHFAYFAERILEFYNSRKEKQGNQQIEKVLSEFLRYYRVSKAISCLSLECYEQLLQSLQLFGHQKLIVPQHSFWLKLKKCYDSLIQSKKLKQLQQMDHFEHVFISSYRPNQSSNTYRPQLALTQQEAAQAVLKLCVLKYLSKFSSLGYLLLQKAELIQSFLDNWIASYKKIDILLQFKLLLKQGQQSKLKLNIIGNLFGDFFHQVYDILSLTHNQYFKNALHVNSEEKTQELQAVEVYRNRIQGIRTFAINIHTPKGLQCAVLLKKSIKKFEICGNLVKKERSRDGFSLLTDDSGLFQPWSGGEGEGKGKYSTSVQDTLAHILSEKNDKYEVQFPKKYVNFTEKEDLKKQEITEPFQSPNCIECHSFLPLLLTGGKAQIEVSNFNNLKAQSRIKCANMSDIVKLHSSGQRVGALDSNGTLSLYNLQPAYQNKCLYSLKKNSILDFCFLSSSQLGVISANGVQVFDTLLHPNRQLKFKENLSKEPLSVCKIEDTKMIVLRKGDVLVYDLRMERMIQSKELRSRGRSILVEGNFLYIGQADARVRVLSLKDMNDACEAIKMGGIDERDREKIGIQQLLNCQGIVLALTNESSIYCLPKIPAQ